jgi:predicted negative regulator of RcsB-dependent stress response
LDGKNDWLYRPLSMVMFAVEWELSPGNPALGHWLNVLLYALTSVLLLKLLFSLFRNYNVLIPFSIALIWIIHPLHTEVVANIKSRDEILSFLFCILMLQCFFNYAIENKIKSIVAGSIFYFLALMSKESAITVLAVTPLVIYFFTELTIKRNLLISSVLLIPSVIYIIIRGMVLTSQLNLGDIPLVDNSLVAAQGDFMLEKGTAFYILGLYLKLLFFPVTLSSDYSYNAIPLVSFSNPVALISLLVHLGLLIYSLIKLPKKDPVSFGILFYLITLSIVANVAFLTRSTMADRFLYMPSLGFSISLIMLLARIIRIDIKTKNVIPDLGNALKHSNNFTIVLLLIITAGSIRTLARNSDWKNDTTIFSNDSRNVPNSSRLHFLYGNHMMQEVKEGKVTGNAVPEYYAIAEKELIRCLEINPVYSQAYINLADLYTQMGHKEKTLNMYRKMIDQKTDLPLAYSNLGNIFFKSNQLDTASVLLKKAIEIDPQFVTAYNNLGSVYFNQGKLDSAIVNFRKAVELSPLYSQAWKNLGSSYGTKGELDKAIDAFQKALEISPSDQEAQKYLDITIQQKQVIK